MSRATRMLFKHEHGHSIFAAWLPAAVSVTMSACLAYGCGQFMLRASANDPQVQLARDGAAALAAGAPPGAVVPSGSRMDAATALAPFVAVYDAGLVPEASSAQLAGQMPKPPTGVFLTARAKGENRVTWAPQPGVRLAAVITSWKNDKGSGYVLAARSLRETEAREDRLLTLVAFGWFVALVATFAAAFGAVVVRRK